MQHSKRDRPRRDRPGSTGRYFVGLLLACSAGSAAAETKVVVSSKPLHALVASVMGATGTPTVLVAGAASPHSYAMKPSDAKAANGADVFFRISETLEPFTTKLVKSLPSSVRVVSMIDAPKLTLVDRRESGAFEADGHDDHGHASAKGQAEDERDPHIWLDPENAGLIVDHVAKVLSEIEPANAATLNANAAAAKLEIAALAAELARELEPLAGKPFVVLHDAYQYFERRFGMTAVGSIAVSPEAAPSGKRLSAIRKKLANSGATCVFAEPGMQPKVVRAVIENSKARSGMLDPEATQLDAGPKLYGALMRRLAAGFKQCLGAN